MHRRIVIVEGVLGDGPFVQVGTPTALAASLDLVVLGGDRGAPQWNGRSMYDRSDRSVGWYPVGIYRANDLSCVKVLTSRWPVNAAAIHPDGAVIALGTGAYDGGYAFEGELLLHDLGRGTTTSVLTSSRTIEALEWYDNHTLAAVVAPITDEDEDWPHVRYRRFDLHRPDWAGVGPRSVDLGAEPSTEAGEVAHDPAQLRMAVVELAERYGATWEPRGPVWAVAVTDEEVVAGSDSAIGQWDRLHTLRRRTPIDGSCTQLLVRDDRTILAGIWQAPDEEGARSTVVVGLDRASGTVTVLVEPGTPALVVTAQSGHVLVRDTGYGLSRDSLATVLPAAGGQHGTVDVGRYDIFNHYFEIRRAPELLVLVGDDRRPHQDKHVVAVRRTTSDGWGLRRLFPLDWHGGRHLFGGPGVFVDDDKGPGIIHAGAVHDGAGLVAGNAFVVRRRYPGGDLVWHVPLDNQVTAVDEAGGRVVALTNLGELVVIDAADGSVLGLEEWLTVDGHPVVPLSLALDGPDHGWVGTLDGRVLDVTIAVNP